MTRVAAFFDKNGDKNPRPAGGDFYGDLDGKDLEAAVVKKKMKNKKKRDRQKKNRKARKGKGAESGAATTEANDNNK